MKCFAVLQNSFDFHCLFRSFNGHSRILQIWKSVQLSKRKTRRFHCIQGKKTTGFSQSQGRELATTSWIFFLHWYLYKHFILSPNGFGFHTVVCIHTNSGAGTNWTRMWGNTQEAKNEHWGEEGTNLWKYSIQWLSDQSPAEIAPQDYFPRLVYHYYYYYVQA